MRGEMATYGLILLYVIPVFFTLVVAEKCYGWYWKKHDTAHPLFKKVQAVLEEHLCSTSDPIQIT
jgi:hypothetical protein